MKSKLLLLMVSLFAVSTAFAAINLKKYNMYLLSGNATAGQDVELSLNMKNENAIATWQTDLKLPEGVTFVSASIDGNRYPEAYAPVLTPTVNADGSVTLLCEGEDGEAMTGTDGTIAKIVLNVSKDVEPGEVLLYLDKIIMFDANNKRWAKEEAVEYKLTVEAAPEPQGDPEDVNGDGTVDVADVVNVYNVMAGAEGETADVNGDGSVDVADVVAIYNKMAE